MLKLPTTTRLNKPLAKKAIFAKFNLKSTAKEKFDSDISKIAIVNEVSSVTTTIDKGNTVESFFVLLVTMKQEVFDEKNITLLSRLINQKMLFVLAYNEKAKLSVYHTKLLQSDWYPIDELSIALQGLNLDTVWENVVVQVGNIQIEQGRTLDEQIRLNEEREKLQHQIELLERQARAEKQPKRKFELVQEIKKLENKWKK